MSVYILTSIQQLFSVEVRAQESRQGDGASSASLALSLKRQLSADAFEEQQNYLSTAATAVYVSLNKIDQRNRFKASVQLTSDTQDFNFIAGSSSSGLGYALALFDAWWTTQLGKPGFTQTLYATGEIATNGEIIGIGYVAEKINHLVAKLDNQSPGSFVICLPKANVNDIDAELRQRVEQKGGQLFIADRLQDLLQQLLGDAYDGDPLGRWEAFKGLKSFEYEDSIRFFGRDKDIERLNIDLQNNQGVLIVSGQSGSGKSSLIKAGLIPYLEKHHPSLSWHTTTPKEIDGSLLDYVLRQLNLHLPEDQQYAATALDELAEAIRQGKANPDQLAAFFPQSNTLLLLHIDQFEEYYTSAQQQANRIALDQVHELTKQLPQLKVIVSIRNEYIAILLESGTIKSPVISNVTGNLSLESWQEIIYEQAAFSGYTFEQQPQDLASVIIDQAIKTPNALPMVEFLLEQIAEKAKDSATPNLLKHQDYETLGGLEGAIATRANDIIDVANSDSKYIHHFFSLFVGVTNDGLAYAKRFTYLQNGAQLSQPLNEMIKKSIDANILISASKNTDQVELNLAHDCLFTQWQAVKDWLSAQKDYLQWRNDTANKFNLWKKSKSKQLLINDKYYLTQGTKYLDQDIIPEVDLIEYINISKKIRVNKIKLFISTAVIVSSVFVLAANNYLFGLYNSQELWTLEDVVTPRVLGVTKKYAEFKIGSYAVSEHIDKLGIKRNTYVIGNCTVTLGIEDEKVVSVRMFASDGCDIDVSSILYSENSEKKMLTDTTFEDWSRRGYLNFTSEYIGPMCNACGESDMVFGHISPLGMNNMIETQVGASIYDDKIAEKGFDKWRSLLIDANIDLENLPISKSGCPLHEFDAQAFELMKNAKISSIAFGRSQKSDVLQPQCSAVTYHQFRSSGEFVELPDLETKGINNGKIIELNHDSLDPITEKVIHELWDEASRKFIIENPKFLKGLDVDVKSGVFYLVTPFAEFERQLDGENRTNLDYYLLGGKSFYNEIAELAKNKYLLDQRLLSHSSQLEKDKIRIKEAGLEIDEYKYLIDNIFLNSLYVKKLEYALKYEKELNP